MIEGDSASMYEMMEIITDEAADQINKKVEAQVIKLEEIHQTYAKASKELSDEESDNHRSHFSCTRRKRSKSQYIAGSHDTCHQS
jgi:hypothetical protein